MASLLPGIDRKSGVSWAICFAGRLGTPPTMCGFQRYSSMLARDCPLMDLPSFRCFPRIGAWQRVLVLTRIGAWQRARMGEKRQIRDG